MIPPRRCPSSSASALDPQQQRCGGEQWRKPSGDRDPEPVFSKFVHGLITRVGETGCSPCPVLRGEHNKADFASLVALASRNWIAYWRALSSKPIAASLVPSLRTCIVRQGCDIVTKIKDAPERQTATAEPRCPNCTAPPRLRHTLLDPRRGRTVRLFECSTCGEWIWDD